MQQLGGQTWNGGHRFQMGGPGTTGPPAGDNPVSSVWNTTLPSCILDAQQWSYNHCFIFTRFSIVGFKIEQDTIDEFRSN